MAFDGITVRALTKELDSVLAGGRIDKIQQPEKDEIVILVHTRDGVKKLLLSANSNIPRVYIAKTTKNAPQTAPQFCMFLRKHIGSGKIVSVTQPSLERIVKIEIESYNELGDLTKKYLICEIMNKYSNIILVGDDGIIMNAIKHVDLTVSGVRQVLPGLFYELPPSQDKINPLESDADALSDKIEEFSETQTPDKAVLSSTLGISPLLAREVCHTVLPDTLSENEPLPIHLCNRLANRISDIYKMADTLSIAPCVVFDENADKYLEFSFFEITQYKGIGETTVFDSLSEAMDTYYSASAQKNELSVKQGELVRVIQTNLERCSKKLNLQLASVKKAENREQLRVYGELLSANIYRLEAGMKSITLENFYDENMSQVTIPLDETLSPARNVQRYFTKYNKAKATEAEATKQIKLTGEEIEYLESVRDVLDRCETLKDLSAVKEELTEQGYIRHKEDKQNKRKKQNSKKDALDINPITFVTSDGFTVNIGRNNKQNDILTLKKSHGNDLWMHTKDIHGSHTVITAKYGEEFTETAILEAARACAYHSKARNSTNVPVDYTIIKNVKKPSGAKPGMVIYVSYNTVYVDPYFEQIES